MISDKAENHILWAVRDEMNTAIENHGEYNSHHEGWAILREEVQEVVECFVPFSNVTSGNINGLWDLIRMDAMCEDEAVMLLQQIYETAEEMTKECVQVMAVCDKWRRLIGKERGPVDENCNQQ